MLSFCGQNKLSFLQGVMKLSDTESSGEGKENGGGGLALH